ncbi:MAG: hypothetical protein M3Z06_03650, partial [Actinomycetota bacterium]|nr:hypothetical protein [Actinomycetota bacterium]
KIARARLRAQVRDPELREKLTPEYSLGCKRIIVSDDYHPSLTRPNVEVITSAIRRINPSSILTEDGVERPVDTIVLGTGFHPFHAADPVRGRDGVTLAERWARAARPISAPPSPDTRTTSSCWARIRPPATHRRCSTPRRRWSTSSSA